MIQRWDSRKSVARLSMTMSSAEAEPARMPVATARTSQRVAWRKGCVKTLNGCEGVGEVIDSGMSLLRNS